MKDIVVALDKEGLGPEQCSSDEVVRVLYTRQKELADKLEEAENVLSACTNGDPRPVIQVRKRYYPPGIIQNPSRNDLDLSFFRGWLHV